MMVFIPAGLLRTPLQHPYVARECPHLQMYHTHRHAMAPTQPPPTTHTQYTPTHQAIEALDGSGKVFRQDHWKRGAEDANAGYGITCVLEDGDLIEKV